MNAIPPFARAALTINTPVPPAPDTGHQAPVLQEGADLYAHVLFLAVGGRLRIIACRDDVQWIVQTRRPLCSNHPRPWRSQAFCTTTKGLRRSLKPLLDAGLPGLWEFVNRLPQTYPRGGRSAAQAKP